MLWLQADHLEGGCGARTSENERLQLAERSYGRCHLSHHGVINTVAVKVQEDDVGAGLQPAHQLHQLIAAQLPEAFSLIKDDFKFSVLPAVAALAQVYVKREGEGGVEHQLQVLREGHGRQGGGRVAKGGNSGLVTASSLGFGLSNLPLSIPLYFSRLSLRGRRHFMKI